MNNSSKPAQGASAQEEIERAWSGPDAINDVTGQQTARNAGQGGAGAGVDETEFGLDQMTATNPSCLYPQQINESLNVLSADENTEARTVHGYGTIADVNHTPVNEDREDDANEGDKKGNADGSAWRRQRFVRRVTAEDELSQQNILIEGNEVENLGSGPKVTKQIGVALCEGERDDSPNIDEGFTQDQLRKLRTVVNIFANTAPTTADILKKSQEQMPKKPRENLLTVREAQCGYAFFNEDFKDMSKRLVVYDTRSLFCLHGDYKIRKCLVWLTCSPIFEYFITLIIGLNSIVLASADYNDRDNKTYRNQLLDMFGQVFTNIFIAEAALKILAMGFIVHKNSYLRDAWNVLDFIVVVIGIVEYLPVPSANLKALRTLRVLRPLRSINAFPSMKKLVSSLLMSLPSLANAVVFMMFIFIIFAILGTQSFQGKLYNRCRTTEKPYLNNETGKVEWPIAEEIERLCDPAGQGAFSCPAGYTCGNPLTYPKLKVSLETDAVMDQESINYAIPTFDNILVALVTIFQMVTLEGWSGIMYNLWDASQVWLAVLFCVLVVVIGSFFLLNVILAVIMDAFSAIDSLQKAQDEKREKDYREMLRLYNIKDPEISMSDDSENENPLKDGDGDSEKASPLPADGEDEGPEDKKLAALLELPKQQDKKLDTEEGIDLEGTAKLGDWRHGGNEDLSVEPIMVQPSKSLEAPLKQKNTITKVAVIAEEDESGDAKPAIVEVKNEGQIWFGENQSEPEEEELKEGEVPARAQDCFLYRICYYICISNAFNFSMVFAIVFNTGLLSLDKYPISFELASTYENMNETLSWIFFAEMLIKLLGLGPKVYVQDSFNVFDGVVVLISIVEIAIKRAGVSMGGGGAFSGLRAIRLLRVFKLARSWTSFRELLAKILVTLGDIYHFSVLMLLFMFIQTLLGMELFAYKVKFNNEDKEQVVDPSAPGEYPRVNFNNILDGFTTIFIVFLGEDWNAPMYDHTRALGFGCVIYFIQLFIMGNIILLNLFLAILLENFEEPPAKEEEEATDASDGKVGILERLKSYLCYCCYQPPTEVNPLSDGQLSPTGNRTVQVAPLTSEIKIKDLQAQPSSARYSGRRKGSESNMFKVDSKGKIVVDTLSPKVGHTRVNFTADKREDSDRKLQRTESKVAKTEVKKNSTVRMLDPNTASKRIGMSTLLPNRDDGVDLMARAKTQLKGSKRMTTSFTLGSIKQMEALESTQPKSVNLKLRGDSLFCLSPKNPLRLGCAAIAGHHYFENFILFLIVFSTIMLTLENPLDDPEGSFTKSLKYIDMGVTALFTLELLIKILANGFLFNGKNSYLRVPANIMDFFIVIISIVSLSLGSAVKLGFLKVLRLIRVLRPLRMISRNPGLRIAIMSLFNAIPDIGNVLVVSLLFLLLFAILFTTFFKGTFWSCDTSNVPAKYHGLIKDKYDCMDYGGDWINADQNFDNVGSSMQTLFNVMTTEGWIGVMHNAVDSTRIDEMPKKNEQPFNCLFFFSFMFVGSLFVLNMFVGVTINVFNTEKDTLQLNHLLTELQTDWCEVLIQIYKQKPPQKFIQTGSVIKDQCYMVANHPVFEYGIIACIILNTVVLGSSFYDQPNYLEGVFSVANLVFNIIYTMESLIKLIAYGCDFFNDGWNNFDLTIVFTGWLGFIADNIDGLDFGEIMTVFRAFRIARVFKLVKKYKDLKILFFTFLSAIPQLTYVGGLLILFLFVYSVLGVQLFSTVKLQDAINVHANFRTFPLAMITLFRMSTGESWHELMYDCARQKSITYDCEDSQTYEEMLDKDGKPDPQGCGDPAGAPIFFISFMLVVSFIFLNLFIAIILESFNNSQTEEGLQVGSETLATFNEIWSEFDPKGSGFLPVLQMRKLLNRLVDEEIRQIFTYREQVENGEVGEQEEVKDIFLFNLHSDESLQTVTFLKVERMREIDRLEKTAAEEEQQQEEIAMEGGSPQKNIGNVNHQESIKKRLGESMTHSAQSHRDGDVLWLSQEEQKRALENQIIKKLLNQFIAKMAIPCYGKLQYYYYYDVLEILSRHLFQMLLTKMKEEYAEEARSRRSARREQEGENSDDSHRLSNSSDSESSDLADAFRSVETNKDGSKGAANKTEEESDDESKDSKEEQGEDKQSIDDRVQIEHLRHVRKGDLELVLKSLEEKGSKHNILKFKEMSQLRARVNQDVIKMLDEFGVQKGAAVLDSSHVVYGLIISKFMRKIMLKRLMKKAAEKDCTLTEKEKALVEAKKRQRVAQVQMYRLSAAKCGFVDSRSGSPFSNKKASEGKNDVSGELVDQRDPPFASFHVQPKQSKATTNMFQIQEAENEDKDVDVQQLEMRAFGGNDRCGSSRMNVPDSVLTSHHENSSMISPSARNPIISPIDVGQYAVNSSNATSIQQNGRHGRNLTGHGLTIGEGLVNSNDAPMTQMNIRQALRNTTPFSENDIQSEGFRSAGRTIINGHMRVGSNGSDYTKRSRDNQPGNVQGEELPQVREEAKHQAVAANVNESRRLNSDHDDLSSRYSQSAFVVGAGKQRSELFGSSPAGHTNL